MIYSRSHNEHLVAVTLLNFFQHLFSLFTEKKWSDRQSDAESYNCTFQRHPHGLKTDGCVCPTTQHPVATSHPAVPSQKSPVWRLKISHLRIIHSNLNNSVCYAAVASSTVKTTRLAQNIIAPQLCFPRIRVFVPIACRTTVQ